MKPFSFKRAALAARSFIRREAVFSAALAAALVSMLVTPPSAEYFGYIDYDVLMLLFTLMGVVKGLSNEGVFALAARSLVRRASNLRALALVLMGLCFFSSMALTNDVALITFVPLTLLMLAPYGEVAIKVVVLETVAANLGSMTTPIGNPQNIYLFQKYSLLSGDFFSTMLPYTALSAVLLALSCIAFIPRGEIKLAEEGREEAKPRKLALALYLALFALALLAVFRVIPKWAAFALALLTFLIYDRRVLRSIDYMLLATFACFFVFVGNISADADIAGAIGGFVAGRELLSGVAASQVISNVPSALLLAPFTENWRPLLIGVNLGGLGTLIASLASLISYRLYSNEKTARRGRFFLVFTVANVAFLAALLLLALMMGEF